MNPDLAFAQTLKYAEELRELHAQERTSREAAEGALRMLEDSYSITVRALATALEMRDDQTGRHAERVTEIALRLSGQIAHELIADPQLEYGFLLHDIGKIGIPDGILLKPGPLTAKEREHMQEHPSLGERIVGRVPYLSGLARQIVAAHHEHWNGGGYPRGLSGAQIPLAARIFAVVDSFDAMTNNRPYRQALPLERALDELEKGTGSQFDPAVVEAFLPLARDLRNAA